MRTTPSNHPGPRALPNLIVAALLIAFVTCAWWPGLQETANAQVDKGLGRALATFAIARTLNAVISVAQETDLTVQPFGVGVKLAPGQVLDPVNDLVESFSDLMLMACIAFGVQKVLLMLFGANAVTYALTAAAGIWLLLFARGRAPVALTRFVVVLLVVRVGFPLVLVAGEQLHQQLMKTEYEASKASIQDVAASFGDAHRMEAMEKALTPPPPSAPAGEEAAAKGWWEKARDAVQEPLSAAKNAAQWPSAKLNALQEQYQALQARLEERAERMIRLMAIFIVETVLVPIGLLWLLARLAGGSMRGYGATRP